MKHILVAFFALAFFSCKQNTDAQIQTAPSQSEEKAVVKSSSDLNDTKNTTAVTFKTEEATQVHEAYLELKAALVNTDATDAAEVAQEFKQMVGAVAESTSITKLKAALEVIATAKEAKQQRVAFENVSIQVEAFLSGNIEYAFCMDHSH